MHNQPTKTRTTAADKALEIISAKGMARLHEIKAAGIPEMVVSRLAQSNRIVRLARGLYQLPDADIEAGHTLAEVAKTVPNGIICLISALAYQELTLQSPSVVWVAIEGQKHPPKREYPPMRFVHFNNKGMIEGIDHKLIEGVTVKITTPARTIVDCFRFRNKIGVDIGISAMREAFRRRICTPDDVMLCARSFRMSAVIKPYIETLTNDPT
jgi:predicted transcriptional regulator of viral defense system